VKYILFEFQLTFLILIIVAVWVGGVTVVTPVVVAL
jgi:hypothetical protein